MVDQGETELGGAEGTGADASAAAIGVALARSSRSGAANEKAAAFLDEQTRLVRLQIENLEGDRALQHRHLALRFFGDRLRIGLQLLAILIGLVVVAGLSDLVWQAHKDRGLVVEPFSAPPSMAADGLTGQVVAARFLDRLKAMQTSTASERPADTFQNDWGSDIKVEIPQTGLTLSELEDLLREKLGHASHLTGEVFRTPAGISITARLGDDPPRTFTAPAGDIDDLTQKAAEAIYRTSQPYRFAEYLEQHGRIDEAFGVISDLAANGPRSERGWAYALWGFFDLNDHGDLAAARAHGLKGLGYTKGADVQARIDLVNAAVWAGHDQEDLSYMRVLDQNVEERAPETTKSFFETNRMVSHAYMASLFGDEITAIKDWIRAGRIHDPFAGYGDLPFALAATADVFDHDPQSAIATMAPLEPVDDTAFLKLNADGAFYGLPNYWLAAARGEWPAAAADARESDAWLEAHKGADKVFGLMQAVWIRPLEARALARSGDLAGAQTLIATTPADCYLCVRTRGLIATEMKDWPSAERWFAEAARQAPSLPFAFSEWGEMRLAKGDLSGAIKVFQIAHRNGPRFADPLKGWGDALARQERWSDALAKYKEALEYAPAWAAARRAKEAAGRHVA